MASTYVGDGDGNGGVEDFGSTGGLHAGLMGVLWSPLANVAILLALNSWWKWGVWIHSAFFFFATIITLVSSIPIIIYTGLIQANSPVIYDDYSAATLNLHYILGLVACGGISVVSLGGIITKVLNLCQARSNTILLFRRIHTWMAYVIIWACKVNIYIMGEGAGAWIAIDIISVIIYICWIIFWPKLEHREISPKYEKEVPSIKAVKDLDQSKTYVVFANMVYDSAPLKYNHPAGYQIIKSVENKEVDRFIYGTTWADELPEVRMWSHTWKSFWLLDDPIAKLDIKPTFQGFGSQEVECNIPSIKRLSKKGGIHMINLTKKEGDFNFVGYQDIEQIGRYFSLTMNDKVTRLYTTVNFLVDDNSQFLEKVLKRYRNWLMQEVENLDQTRYEPKGKTNQSNRTKNEAQSADQIQQPQEIILHTRKKNSSIPIMFKTYAEGKFSEGIVKGPVTKMMVSNSKGEGLQLTQTKPGRIVMVAGGTGLYPFSDFIDLLYKEELMKHQPEFTEEILKLSPVLKDSPFKKWSFEMLAAFGHVEDMHMASLEQLLYLAEKGRMKITFKFKEDPHGVVEEGKNIDFTSTGFHNLLEQKMSEGNVSRVWICGPPGMNQMVSKFMREKYDDPDLYLIV